MMNREMVNDELGGRAHGQRVLLIPTRNHE